MLTGYSNINELCMLVAFRSSSVKSVNIKGGKGGHFFEYIIEEYWRKQMFEIYEERLFLYHLMFVFNVQ